MKLKTIKHFTFDENHKLGQGSTGTVYLGTDLRNNQPIAVKAIELKNIDNEVTQYLLKNQIKALRMTNHPNVLKAIDVIQEPEFVYIVTDYLPKGTLAEYIQKLGSIPEAESLQIFKQIVDGYDHIFDLKIYHRDLKPHNILFDSNFRPVLSDFGYCQITGFLPKPKLQYNVGSPGFMAPESIVGNLYSQNSQVWSLGAILYEMMTGKNYTNGKAVMEAVMLIKKQGPYYPDNASPLTRTIIKESMMLKPQNRMKVKTLKQLLHEKVKQIPPNNRSTLPGLNNFGSSLNLPHQEGKFTQATFLGQNGQPMIMNVHSPQKKPVIPNSHNTNANLLNNNHQIPQAHNPQMSNIPTNPANLQNVPAVQNSTNGLPNPILPQNQMGAPFNPNQQNRIQQQQININNKLQQRIQVGENNAKPNIIRNLSPRKRAQRGSIVGANKFEEPAQTVPIVPSILKPSPYATPQVPQIQQVNSTPKTVQILPSPQTIGSAPEIPLLNQQIPIRGSLQQIPLQNPATFRQSIPQQSVQQMNSQLFNSPPTNNQFSNQNLIQNHQNINPQTINPQHTNHQNIMSHQNINHQQVTQSTIPNIQNPQNTPNVQNVQNQNTQNNQNNQHHFQGQQNPLNFQHAAQYPVIQSLPLGFNNNHNGNTNFSSRRSMKSSFASQPDSAPFYMPNLNDSMDDEYHMMPSTNRSTMPNPSITQSLDVQQTTAYQQILHQQLGNNLNVNSMQNGSSLFLQPQINSLSPINNNMTTSFQGNQSLKNSQGHPVIMHPVPVFNSQYSNVIVPNPYNYYGH